MGALLWVSGALLMGSLWQMEIIHIREKHGEPFETPFYLTSDKRYSFWRDITTAGVVLSVVIGLAGMAMEEKSAR